MKPKVFIRADGSAQVGLGHLIRCSALAHMLKNDFQVTFYCQKIPELIAADFSKDGFGIIRIREEQKFLDELTTDIIVVIDRYGFDTNYQRRIKGKGCKLVCIDDLHDQEFFADLIINHTPGITSEDYLAQPYTRFALGLEYALLRPAFLEQAKKERAIIKIETVMICFGGSDPKNLTQSVIEIALIFQKFKKIIAVTGQAYQVTEGFRRLITSDARIEHRHALGEEQMLETMLEADLAIVPASGILLEVFCCNCLPLICYTADNQSKMFNYLITKYNIDNFGNNVNNFQHELLYNQLLNFQLPATGSVEVFPRILNNATSNVSKKFNELINK